MFWLFFISYNNFSKYSYCYVVCSNIHWCTGCSLSDQLNILQVKNYFPYISISSMCSVHVVQIKLFWTTQKFKTIPCRMKWVVNVLSIYVLAKEYFCKYFPIFWLDSTKYFWWKSTCKWNIYRYKKGINKLS